MIHAIRMTVTGLVLAALGGCASTSGARSAAPTNTGSAAAQSPGERGPAGGMMGGMCPMAVSGTTVATIDVEGGAALVFTTRTGDVAELRRRVRAMAAMHNRHAGGTMMGGPRAGEAAGEHEHAAGGGVGPGMMSGEMMPAASASVEDIEGGARLVLTPKDPAQLEALRQHVRARAERMQRGECAMMAPE